MKRFLPILSFAVLLAACNTTSEKEAATQVTPTQQQMPDTSGLAQFQQWKAQNELAAATPVAQPVAEKAEAPVREVRVVREVRRAEPAPVRRTVKNSPVRKTTTASKNTTAGSGTTGNSNGSGSADNGTAGTGTSEGNAPAAEAPKKEGWSNAAKGAVIGGAGGAVVGAVINKKNRAAGAAIGAAVGGAIGYGIGKARDKKENNSE